MHLNERRSSETESVRRSSEIKAQVRENRDEYGEWQCSWMPIMEGKRGRNEIMYGLEIRSG